MDTLWHLRVCEHFAQFRADTGVSKHRLAAILGLHASDITPSALTNPQKGESIAARLQHRLAVANLREVALHFELSFDEFRHLERLAARVDTEISGWPKDMTAVIGSLREARDMGMNGVELQAAGNWQVAIPLLREAWCYLTLHDIGNDKAALYTRVRVGSQLLEWHSFQGVSPHATALRRELHATVRTVRSPNSLLRLSTGWAYSAIGTSLMHDNADPRLVIEKHELARARFAERPDLAIRCRLNEIRALAQLELQQAGGVPVPGFKGRAAAALDEVYRLVGDTTPAADFREEWLLAKLSKIHDLYFFNSAEEAQCDWELLGEQGWIRDHLAPLSKRPLRSYLALTRIALASTQREFGLVERLATEFCADSDNLEFRERLTRVRRLRELARNGDYPGLVRCIVN